MSQSIPLSALDLAVVVQDSNAAQAIQGTVAVAQHVEKLGFRRIWLAEHHNMPHIASAATAVLIGHVAGATRTIRVGSGGIMLPNHSPLVIAEQFGTLETLYPGRIDLGLGRAPGTDQLTAMALRRSNMNTAFSFPSDIGELKDYFQNDDPDTKVRAFPGEGLDIPLWILGSSTDSAHLAARLGLPYAFAAHFAPAMCEEAVAIYRREFQPSDQLDKPYVIVCVNAFGAETDQEAFVLSTSMFRMFAGIVTNLRQPLQPPVPSLEPYWTPEIENAVSRMTAYTFIGAKDSLRKQFLKFRAHIPFDELMITSHIYDQEARLASYTIVNDAVN